MFLQHRYKIIHPYIIHSLYNTSYIIHSLNINKAHGYVDISIHPYIIHSLYNTSYIIHSLNINKAHGYVDISIRLLKICDSSIVRPLSIIFENCLQSRSFPIFKYFKKNSLLCQNQSGFCPSGSCENQLLSIAHDMLNL